MTPLSSFRSRIAPRVLTAPDIVIDQAVLDTCIDFCERTLIIRTSDAADTVTGVNTVDIPVPAGQALTKVMRAWCNGIELVPISDDEVSGPLDYTETVTGASQTLGMPRFMYEPAPGVLGLHPAPDDAYQITFRLACKPKRSATSVEDVLYENWVDPIVDGALARLYGMPGMQFSAPPLVIPHQAMYMTGVNRAMLEAVRGRNRAEMRVRPVRI
jgi:hypothetical protein